MKHMSQSISFLKVYLMMDDWYTIGYNDTMMYTSSNELKKFIILIV